MACVELLGLEVLSGGRRDNLATEDLFDEISCWTQ